MRWNWQQPDWPRFTFETQRLTASEDNFLLASGVLLGAYLHLPDAEKETFTVDLLSTEALKTSEIEGEMLRRDSVQSSIRKRFGLASGPNSPSPSESGIAEMMVDLYRHFSAPLTHQTLYAWHAMMMNGRRELTQIGAYRQHAEPMQVVSGRIDAPKIHFEAPPSTQVPAEMDRFIRWFNDTGPNGKTPLPALTRAGIAHLYFESIHPFEDGNGRLGRSVSEKALAQAIGKPVLVGLSETIQAHRKRYYQMLEDSNKSQAITDWLLYFADVVLTAQKNSHDRVAFVIAQAAFYDRFRETLNPRQQKVMARIFREGPRGFKGGLSAEKYLALTGTSRATATRDLTDLVEKGALTKSGIGKGTRYFPSLR